MRKLTPIAFTGEDDSNIQSQLGVQETPQAQPKSVDPINYPVWGIPVGKKALIYVPKHIVQDAEGVDRLRMDNPLLHYITIGKRYPVYRCINGLISEAHGLNGTCPLCEGSSEPWDLANKIIEQKCKQQGLDPADTENKDVKSIRSSAFSDRAVKDAVRHFTFPIVVFDTLNDDGKTFVKDEEGGYKYKIYWYDCSDTIWNDKWLKALEAMEDEPTHPGGMFFLLNYIYQTKNNQPQNARDAARNLTISPRTIKGSEAMRDMLDKQTEGWDPIKARQTIYANMIYSEADLQGVADEALENTRNLNALYDANAAGAGAANGSSAGFTLEKPSENAGAIEDQGGNGAMPMETDLDVE